MDPKPQQPRAGAPSTEAEPAEGSAGSATPAADPSPLSELEVLPTRVRAAADSEMSHWESTLPVPPAVDAEAEDWGEDEPTLAPSELPAAANEHFETEEDPRIPVGQGFFKIGEVARIVGVKPYVLRYWEGELSAVRPEKTSTRQRRYRRKDVAVLLQVRRLRHDEKLSIARIRMLLKRGPAGLAGAQVGQGEGGAALAPGSALTSSEQTRLRGRLDEMRHAVMDLLEAVED